MALRVTLMAVAGVVLAAAAFVLLHSGALGDAACERSRFVPSTGLSAWPPGARCTYGEPPRTDVVLNAWLVAVVGALALVFVFVASWARPARERTSARAGIRTAGRRAGRR